MKPKILISFKCLKLMLQEIVYEISSFIKKIKNGSQGAMYALSMERNVQSIKI